MIRSTLAFTFLTLTLLTLAACSSSFGDGAHPPQDVTVVVPPKD